MKWNWSWGFGLFIALPALVLALLGLRAVRAERIEREQHLRDQQTQFARLIDASLANRIAAIEVESLGAVNNESISSSKETSNRIYAFSLFQNGVLKFPNQRVYFGEQSPPEWPANTENLIEQAQAAKVQGRNLAALGFYHRISELEPKLAAWAELSTAAVKFDVGDASVLSGLGSGELATSESTTPTGLPVALLASAYLERMPATEQVKLASFVERTIESLRNGRWWLSYDERSFYDGQLQRMLERVAAKHPAEDRQLKHLQAIEQLVRRSAPPATTDGLRYFDGAQGESFLISWSKPDIGSTSRDGFALPRDRLVGLFDSVLSQPLSGQPFMVEVRDAEALNVWGTLRGTAINTHPLRSVRGLELTFGGLGGSRWIDQKQLLWFGFILLLVVMMIAGLAITARVVRREVELGRIQNDFIAAVSHEFKSPIASIRLLMERITTGRLRNSEATAEYYLAISREAERLERLVNRLLEWQQIQAGRKHYNFTPASLKAIATTAIEEMRPRADAKAIHFETKFEEPAATVNVDEAALTDAIENLIDNAIKYSPSGTKIAVSCSSTDHHASIDVRDQGVGIADDELPHIFDRFYRGSRGNMSNVHGTGLGLALVKATVEAHGGEVGVISDPGMGSCFRLRLPIVSEPGAVATGSREPHDPIDLSLTLGGPSPNGKGNGANSDR